MRTLLLTESLGSGGAERQLCLLAVGLRAIGVDVRVVTYSEGDFYRPLLERGGVESVTLRFTSRSERVLGVRRVLKQAAPDVVLSFLQGPNLYAELASLPRRPWGLVVSERGALLPPHSWGTRGRWRLHLLADAVVTNSHANRLQLERAVPGLRRSLVTLYNGIDLGHFYPSLKERRGSVGSARLVVVSTFSRMKNMEGLLRALDEIRVLRPELNVEIDWYGAVPEGRAFDEARSLAAALGLTHRFRFHEPTRDVAGVYHFADALILPSFYEGLPNVACEAMACGKPLLISAVCDAANLVEEGRNGFMFDPHRPRSIANAIAQFADLSIEERARQGLESRMRAEHMFKLEDFVHRFHGVLRSAAAREKPVVEHWVPQVPSTAVRWEAGNQSERAGFR